VKIANDGSEALRCFDSEYPFDLVITDIHMPGVDGNDIAKHIRKSRNASVPIIAITGASDESIQRSLFDLVLKKPFKLKNLDDAVLSLIRQN
jgi:CheY-like chemotaxis protein